jgi:hypothetical protein
MSTNVRGTGGTSEICKSGTVIRQGSRLVKLLATSTGSGLDQCRPVLIAGSLESF